MRRTIVLTAVVSATGVAAWALIGIGGVPADCVPACDCETIGHGSIRQPSNTWSAAAIVVAGIWALATARSGAAGLLAGVAIVLVGLASFAAHASVSAWAYRADGTALVLMAALLAGLEWTGPGVATGAAAGAAAAAAVLGPPASTWMTLAAAAVFLTGLSRRRPKGRVVFGMISATLLGAGAAIRALADDGGPWCRPDALVTGHAIWHLAAAAALVALIGYLRSHPTGPGSAEGDLRSLTNPAEGTDGT